MPPQPVRASSGSVSRGDAAVGGTVYVPIYSHIYTINSQRTTDLTATLSVRNTDGEHPIQIDSVRYYDSEGALLRERLTEPISLGPMASTEFVVERPDRSGGSGANFLIEWQADANVTAPVVEAVMIGASSPPRGVLCDTWTGDSRVDRSKHQPS